MLPYDLFASMKKIICNIAHVVIKTLKAIVLNSMNNIIVECFCMPYEYHQYIFSNSITLTFYEHLFQ